MADLQGKAEPRGRVGAGRGLKDGAYFEAEVFADIEGSEVGVHKGFGALYEVNGNEADIGKLAVFVIKVAKPAEVAGVEPGTGKAVFFAGEFGDIGIAKNFVSLYIKVNGEGGERQPAIDEGQFPPPFIVNLPATGENEGEVEGFFGVGVILFPDSIPKPVLFLNGGHGGGVGRREGVGLLLDDRIRYLGDRCEGQATPKKGMDDF